jgi:hypothetical protein
MDSERLADTIKQLSNSTENIQVSVMEAQTFFKNFMLPIDSFLAVFHSRFWISLFALSLVSIFLKSSLRTFVFCLLVFVSGCAAYGAEISLVVAMAVQVSSTIFVSKSRKEVNVSAKKFTEHLLFSFHK